MGSGFIIGGIWGLIVSAGALAVASLIGPPPVREAQAPVGLQEPDRAPEAQVADPASSRPPATLSAPEPADDTVISLSGEVEVQTGAPDAPPSIEAPGDARPGDAAISAAPQAPTMPAPETADPLPGPASEAPDATDEGTTDIAVGADADADMDTDAGVDGDADAGGTPPPVSAEAPAAPPMDAASVETPGAPEPSPEREALPLTPRADVPAGRGAAPAADTLPEQRPQAGDAVQTPGAAPEIAQAPVEPGAEQPVLPGPPSRVIEIPADEADIAVVTDPPPPPSQAPREVAEAAPDTTPGAEPDPATPQPDAGEVAGADPAAPAPGTITVLPVPETETAALDRALPGRPGGLDGDDAVPVRRPGQPEPAETARPEPLPEDAPALLRFAAPDLGEAGAARLAVVLVDIGALDAPIAAASSIPFPVTIGIDPEAPDAAARAARWREAGYEIAAMARLPVRATPSDVEVSYEAAFDALPEAVALLDAGGAGLNSDGDVTAQALDRLARDGRGLVALSQGLATPLRRAQDSGVPAVEIYRDLGEVGQDDRVIRRFLDQAAFRARQQGAVTLLAELNPETITALTLWGNRVDREGVAPAPVSALLRMQMIGPGK